MRYPLYVFSSTDGYEYIAVFNEMFEQCDVLCCNGMIQDDVDSDDAIDVLEEYKGVEIKFVFERGDNEMYDELEQRYVENRLGVNGVKLYKFIREQRYGK